MTQAGCRRAKRCDVLSTNDALLQVHDHGRPRVPVPAGAGGPPDGVLQRRGIAPRLLPVSAGLCRMCWGAPAPSAVVGPGPTGRAGTCLCGTGRAALGHARSQGVQGQWMRHVQPHQDSATGSCTLYVCVLRPLPAAYWGHKPMVLRGCAGPCTCVCAPADTLASWWCSEAGGRWLVPSVRADETVHTSCVCAAVVPLHMPLAMPLPAGHVRRCGKADRCCSEYESCVSCCLHPKYHAKDRARDRLK